MKPTTVAEDLNLAFLNKVKAANKGGESSIGMAPKGVDAGTFMNGHVKKVKEMHEPAVSSIGMTTHVGADNFMTMHHKKNYEINHMKPETIGVAAHVGADNFLNSHFKQVKEMQAEKSIPHTSSHMTADNFLQNHFNETRKETKTPTQGAFLALEKPSVGTDDFTMSVLKKAQKDVMSY